MAEHGPARMPGVAQHVAATVSCGRPGSEVPGRRCRGAGTPGRVSTRRRRRRAPGGRRCRRARRRPPAMTWAWPKPWSTVGGAAAHVVAPLGQARRPRRRGRAPRPRRPPGRRRPTGRSRLLAAVRRERRRRRAARCQHPPPGPHRPAGRLAVHEQPGEQLQQDLGLGVAAHRAEHGAQRPVGAGDEGRGEACAGGRRPGANARRVPSASVKPMPRSCRKMPVAGSTMWAPHPEAFDWMSVTPMRSRSTAQTTVVPPAAGGGPRRPAGRGRRCARWAVEPVRQRAARRRRRRRAARRRGRRPPTRAASASRCAQAGSSGSSGSVEPGGDAGAGGQRQVALRGRRRDVDGVAPHVDGQRLDPLGLVAGRGRRG